MRCHECGGLGVVGRSVPEVIEFGSSRYVPCPIAPCPNPDCHAGQISCCEVTDDPEANPQEGD